MNAARLWTIGAALIAVLVLVGGYFLVVAPQLDTAAQADSSRQTVETQNEALTQSLAKMKKDSENLPAATKQLAALRESVPADSDMSDFLAELNSMAAVTQVAITNVGVADALPYAGSVTGDPTKPQASPAPTATPAPTDPAAAATGGFAEQSSPLITPANFVAIPVSMTVTGGDPNVNAFLAALQHGSRLFLVNGFTTTPVAAVEATDDAGGSPAGVSAAIKGYVYVYLDDVPATPAPAPAS
ncbi:MAG: hypothetical protein ABWY57_15275 [Mycetocola sp.]